jgi:hypothetical protein
VPGPSQLVPLRWLGTGSARRLPSGSPEERPRCGSNRNGHQLQKGSALADCRCQRKLRVFKSGLSRRAPCRGSCFGTSLCSWRRRRGGGAGGAGARFTWAVFRPQPTRRRGAVAFSLELAVWRRRIPDVDGGWTRIWAGSFLGSRSIKRCSVFRQAQGYPYGMPDSASVGTRAIGSGALSGGVSQSAPPLLPSHLEWRGQQDPPAREPAAQVAQRGGACSSQGCEAEEVSAERRRTPHDGQCA